MASFAALNSCPPPSPALRDGEKRAAFVEAVRRCETEPYRAQISRVAAKLGASDDQELFFFKQQNLRKGLTILAVGDDVIFWGVCPGGGCFLAHGGGDDGGGLAGDAAWTEDAPPD